MPFIPIELLFAVRSLTLADVGIFVLCLLIIAGGARAEWYSPSL